MRLVALVCLLSLAQVVVAEDSIQRSPKEWQEIALADLNAVHDAIVRGHPGAIDELNPNFKIWMEDGFSKAKTLVSEVDSYGGVVDVVRYYVTGFRDGHLGYSDDASGKLAPDLNMRVSGWSVEHTPHGYTVVATVNGSGQPVPPLGSTLLQCDGQQPGDLIKERVAPFVDRRNPEAPCNVAALAMGELKSLQLKQCAFKTIGGSELTLPVDYRFLGPGDWAALIEGCNQRKHRDNGFTFQHGTLWIRAANFSLNSDQAKALQRMLRQLRQLRGVRVLVFDVRGNGGGDSGVGGKIFEAATGGLKFDTSNLKQLPQVYAEWRVSEFSLKAADSYVTGKQATYGARSAQVVEAQAFRDELARDQRSGAVWHRQWVDGLDGYLVDRAEMARRHGHLRRYHGPVVLLTDERCASACLDFADLVHILPGSIQVGQTTSSDTLYIHVGFFEMPSGNHLTMPLKVWRNRLRGDSVPWVPDEPIAGNLEDDRAVESAVKAIVARRFGASQTLEKGSD